MEPAVVDVAAAGTGSFAEISSLAVLGAVSLELPKPGRIWGGIFAFNASRMLPALLGADAVAALAGAAFFWAAVLADSVESFGLGGSFEVAESTVSCSSSADGFATPGVSSSFAKIFQLSFIFIEDYSCS